MSCESNAVIDSGTSCRRSERRVAVTITSCSTPSERADSVCACAVCTHAAPGIDRIAEIAAVTSRDAPLEDFLFSPVMTHPVYRSREHRRHVPLQKTAREILELGQWTGLIKTRVHARLIALDDLLVRDRGHIPQPRQSGAIVVLALDSRLVHEPGDLAVRVEQAAGRETIEHDVIAVREPEGHRTEMQIHGATVVSGDGTE